MSGMLKSHPRLLQLFENPHFQGTKNEWEELKKKNVYVSTSKSGIVHVECPYCTWTSLHFTKLGEGYRKCDGPVHSKYTALMLKRKNYQYYDCPGYNIKFKTK